MKLLKNRRKLNNKGFTLIELLAVVVILAIVMGISATSVLNSINNSRVSSLHSAAQTAANNLNTWVSEDFLVTSNQNKKLGDDFVKLTQTDNKDEWICLSEDSPKIMNKKGGEDTEVEATTPLLSALGLSENDIDITGTAWSHGEENTGKDATGKDTEPGCSAIKYNSVTAAYDIVLVAKNGGKYFVGSDTTHYAYSSASSSNIMP